MNISKLEKILEKNNQPKFRLEQIKKAIYQDGISSYLEISTISKELREKLDKEIKILSFEAEKILISEDQRSVKALLRIPCHPELDSGSKNNLKISRFRLRGRNDNYDYIETVLLSPRPGSWTACISSQVGCPLNCAFCATGKGGFKRNLTAEEITDQVLFWRQYLAGLPNDNPPAGRQMTNIVYMGMGEPFLNWENVRKSLEDLIDPKLFGFGSRSISVSTSGIAGGIEKFIQEFPQINLAISLHFVDSEKRSRFMPANMNYDLADLRKDLRKYFAVSKRKIFLECIMFKGINDSLADAKKLIDYLHSIGNTYLLHVNLITYNSTGCNDFSPSPKDKIVSFRNYLLRNKINVTIRKSLGSDIQGACGQLAGF